MKHFTREQIEEIRVQLATKAVRDSDFDETFSIQDEDFVPILQGEKNKRISAENMFGPINEEIDDMRSTFVTRLVDDLINYYTKEELYSKDESYSKEEIDELIRATKNFHYEIYPNRGAVKNPSPNVLYLIGPVSIPEGSDVDDLYQEWVYWNNTWTLIGTTGIELSTKQDKLVSGENIKTVNGQSIVGSGNLEVGDLNAVKFIQQTLTPEQKEQSRTNIGAGTYSLPSGGVPKTDLSQSVQTSLDTADSAYQKPNSGVPKTDLASGVQSSLDLADSSVQANPVGSVTPAVDPYDYATREELSQLGQKAVEKYSGENILVSEMQENAILYNTGTINPSGTGYITTIDYIPVEPGEVYSNSIEGGYFKKFCFYDENKTFISVDVDKMSFTTPQNAAFVRLSFRMAAGFYMLAKSPTPVPYMHPSVISGYVEPVEKDQRATASKVSDILSGMSLITDATATETADKYVNFSTGAISSGSYGYKVFTYPRSVFGKAQIVRAFVAGRNTTPAAIAFYSATPSSDTYMGGVQMVSPEELPGWYEAFIPDNAEYVVVSNAGDYNTAPAVHFVEDKLISGLPDYSYFESVAKDTDETASATITNDYYVRYDVGSLVQSGASTAMQVLQLPILGGVATIRAYAATKDDVPAVIAFYSGEPSSSTYIKSSSIQASSPFNVGKWYEASVPGNAKYVIVSNRYAIVDSPKIEFVKIPALDPLNSELKKKVNFSANPFWNQQFYSHFNPIGLMEDGYGRRLIAGESLDDIRVASRLGFDIIEANLQETSDGVIICTHGQNGFGPAFIDTRTGEQPSGNISDYSYADVLAYIRYNSALDKYKTPPPTLDDFLLCCKKNGIGIMLGVTVLTAENAETAILKARMILNDKVIVYTGGNAPTKRNLFPGFFFRWFNNSGNTYEQIVGEMNAVGSPAICGLGPTTISVLKSADTFEDLVNYLHQNGFLWGTAYATEEEEREYIENGCDLIASTHEVNHFDGSALVVDINDDTPQFVLENATLSDGVVTMSDGGTLTIGTTDKVALGKGMLKIVFSGTLLINFGAIGTRTITSDGSKEIVISDYFLIRKEQLTITASGSAVISNLVYETSKC